MFAQDLEKCQKTLEHEGGKAVDALTVATAAVISDERGRLVLDANEQQEIEDFWRRNFPALMSKATDALAHLLL